MQACTARYWSCEGSVWRNQIVTVAYWSYFSLTNMQKKTFLLNLLKHAFYSREQQMKASTRVCLAKPTRTAQSTNFQQQLPLNLAFVSLSTFS